MIVNDAAIRTVDGAPDDALQLPGRNGAVAGHFFVDHSGVSACQFEESQVVGQLLVVHIAEKFVRFELVLYLLQFFLAHEIFFQLAQFFPNGGFGLLECDSFGRFAAYLEQRMVSGVKRLVFVVGGPYGFSEGVYARADDRVSLSRMTFSHQMVRMIFVEQFYRAMTILKGEPYHHE